jgi:Zn-dependent protease
MNANTWWSRIQQNRIFWLVVGILLIAYIFMIGNPFTFVATILGLLIAITVHECAHAWSANLLGDPTARLMGRVSLNPLVHLDPLGTVMMLVTALTGFGIGWGKPVPVVPWRMRFGARRGNALVALSGPASNLLVALGLGLTVRLGYLVAPQWDVLYMLLRIAAITNIAIGMFNLIPLPPLDGHSVLLGVLSLSRSRVAWELSEGIERLRRHGPMLLIGLLLISQFLGLNIIGRLIGGPTFFIYRLIMGRLA